MREYTWMSDKVTNVSRGTRRVSRRRFVQAASAAGVVSVAGCLGDDDDDEAGPADDFDPDEEAEFDEEVEVSIYGDSDLADLEDVFEGALHEAGMPEEISLDIEAGPSDTDQRLDFMNSQLDAGSTSPDLFMTDSGWTIPFIARDELLSVEDLLPSDTIDYINDNYFDEVINTVSDVDGNLYGVPLFPDFPSMLYRKDLVEDAGYDPDGENWATESIHWEEFNQIAEEVRDANDLDYGFTFQAADYEGLSCCNFNEWITSWGGGFFDDQADLFGPVGDRTIAVTGEPVENALRMIRTFVHGAGEDDTLDEYSQITTDGVLGWIEDDSLGPFTSGDAVFHRNWPYSIPISDEEFGEDLGVMPIPYAVTEDEAEVPGAGGPAAALGGWHIVANPNIEDENLEAAMAVLQYMTSDEVATTMWQEQGWIPPKPELFESDEIREIEPVGRYMDALQVAGENAVARPVTEVWPDQSTVVFQEAHDALTGEKTVEDALADMEDGIAALEG